VKWEDLDWLSAKTRGKFGSQKIREFCYGSRTGVKCCGWCRK